MANNIIIPRSGQSRKWDIHGTPGATLEIYIKQGSNYYNFDTDSFQTAVKKLKAEIPSSGLLRRYITIPQVSSDTSYDYYIATTGSTTSNVELTNDRRVGTLFQKGPKTATFTTTEDTTLSIASALTGGTLKATNTSLEQTGAVTEVSSKFVYIHSVPTWDIETGGAWTNSRTVRQKIKYGKGTIWYVEDGTNITTGLSVTGKNIIDEITVSAISGNMITLSAAQRLTDGQELTFSKSGWEFESIYAKAENSGTTSVTFLNSTTVAKVGIADVTVELDIDEYVSVKPNAFPVNVNCPAGGNVEISVNRECTNYLGELGDNDANQSSKTYAIHSIPAASTSSAAIRTGLGAAIGTLSLDAGEHMGSAGTGEVTYTSHASQIAGDTDIFYYKTTDAQTPTVDSSTTQGIVTVTIV